MKYLEENDDFDKLIEKGTVLVDFYADWCGPCQMLGPVLEKLAEKNKDITILKVNTDNFIELAQKYGIMSIPAIKVFKDGEIANSTVGYKDLNELEDSLK